MRFVLGLILGIALGVSLGLLVAPQPGSETRRVLRERVQRHGEEEEEGGLQLHTAEAIEDSGVVFAGEVDESDLYLRLVLPPDDDEISAFFALLAQAIIE